MIATKQEVVDVLSAIQKESILRNIDGKKGRNPRELLEGLRCGMAIWALMNATDSEVLEWVERNRKSKNN